MQQRTFQLNNVLGKLCIILLGSTELNSAQTWYKPCSNQSSTFLYRSLANSTSLSNSHSCLVSSKEQPSHFTPSDTHIIFPCQNCDFWLLSFMYKTDKLTLNSKIYLNFLSQSFTNLSTIFSSFIPLFWRYPPSCPFTVFV